MSKIFENFLLIMFCIIIVMIGIIILMYAILGILELLGSIMELLVEITSSIWSFAFFLVVVFLVVKLYSAIKNIAETAGT